jgi:hypothetical protein
MRLDAPLYSLLLLARSRLAAAAPTAALCPGASARHAVRGGSPLAATPAGASASTSTPSIASNRPYSTQKPQSPDQYLEVPGGQRIPYTLSLSFVGGPDAPPTAIPVYQTINSNGEDVEGAAVPHTLDKVRAACPSTTCIAARPRTFFVNAAPRRSHLRRSYRTKLCPPRLAPAGVFASAVPQHGHAADHGHPLLRGAATGAHTAGDGRRSFFLSCPYGCRGSGGVLVACGSRALHSYSLDPRDLSVAAPHGRHPRRAASHSTSPARWVLRALRGRQPSEGHMCPGAARPLLRAGPGSTHPMCRAGVACD